MADIPNTETNATISMVDLGDQESVRARNKALRPDAAMRAHMLQAIMQHKEGRKWMYWLLGECHVFAPVFDKNALVMAHSEGERNVGLKILAELQSNHEMIGYYNQMLSEANENG